MPLNSTGEGASVWRREEEGEQTSAYRTQCRRLVRPLIFVLFPGPVNLGTVDSGGHFVLDCRVLSVHPVHCGPSSCLPGLPPLRVSSTATPVCGDQKRAKEAKPLPIVIVHRAGVRTKETFRVHGCAHPAHRAKRPVCYQRPRPCTKHIKTFSNTVVTPCGARCALGLSGVRFLSCTCAQPLPRASQSAAILDINCSCEKLSLKGRGEHGRARRRAERRAGGLGLCFYQLLLSFPT